MTDRLRKHMKHLGRLAEAMAKTDGAIEPYLVFRNAVLGRKSTTRSTTSGSCPASRLWRDNDNNLRSNQQGPRALHRLATEVREHTVLDQEAAGHQQGRARRRRGRPAASDAGIRQPIIRIGGCMWEDHFDKGEIFILKWQYHLHGRFTAALVDLMKTADSDNLRHPLRRRHL